MVVTKQQAMTEREFHYGECKRTVGPRGGETVKIERWRANGACKTWKREPERFQLPIKFGMRGYSYIHEYNAQDFHVASECPLDQRYDIDAHDIACAAKYTEPLPCKYCGAGDQG